MAFTTLGITLGNFSILFTTLGETLQNIPILFPTLGFIVEEVTTFFQCWDTKNGKAFSLRKTHIYGLEG